MKPDLYHHGTSVCSAKVRVTLAEKGVEWNGHYIDTRKGLSMVLRVSPRIDSSS